MKNVSEMTIKEKVGQLVFAGFPGHTYDEHIRKLVEEYKLGNIILFARNVDNIKQLHDLNHKLHEEIMKNTGIMPLISIDQEGGMVTRIMNGATFLPGSMSISATNSNNAYLMGKVSGEELRALGINMNLAPSLDVNNNPLNPVIGVRSYSDKPEVVSEYGLKFIKGLKETGVISTAKHFPGHGDTEADSHYSLPTVPHSKVRLNEVELVPFKKAIEAGVDSIMSAHVFFTAYESDNLPATLSKKVLTNLLREELGFKGLIVSDCMEMKAISDNYTTPKGSLMGLLAGLDMVFVSQTLDNQVATLELIYNSVMDGSFPEELLNEKVERILQLKSRIYPLMKKYFYDEDFQKKYDLVTDPKTKKLSSDIVDKSLTKVRGKDFYPNKKTLVIATEPFATTIAEDEVSSRSIVDMLKVAKIPFYSIKIKVKITDEEIEEINKKARYYEQVIVCTYNAKIFTSQAKLINRLHNTVEDLYVISTRNPYDIHAFSYVKNYLCVYEYTPNSVNTIIKYLNREIPAVGRLPICLNLKPTIGASLYVGLDDYPLSKNLEYLDLLKEQGIEKVFISAHIPEMHEDFKKELNEVIDYANKLNLMVILDVSKPMFENFKLSKIYSLRLDWGFDNEDIIDLYKKDEFIVELNASTVTKEKIDYLRANGIDLSKIRVSHNFYPKPDTGLSFDRVLEINTMLKDYGFNVMGYIPSNYGKRPPLYLGLPTIEEHRNARLDVVLQEMNLLGFSEIVFGDAYASKEEIEYAKKFDFSIIQIPIKLNKDISEVEKEQILKLHRNRLDAANNIIRSSVRTKNVIKPRNTISREKFSVTIDNENMGRYQGEVAILTNNLPANDRVNVVGKVIASKALLDAIKPGDRFKFIVVE